MSKPYNYQVHPTLVQICTIEIVSVTHEYAWRTWHWEQALKARAESAEGAIVAEGANAMQQTYYVQTRCAYIDDALCDFIGCHGYDVNSAATATGRV